MKNIEYAPGSIMKEFTINLSSNWLPTIQPQRPLTYKMPMMPIVVDSLNDAYHYYIGSDGEVYYKFIYSLIESS